MLMGERPHILEWTRSKGAEENNSHILKDKWVCFLN